MNLLTFQLTVLLTLGLLSININAQQMSLLSCLQYSGGVCIRCDRQTHLSQGVCYRNILGCTKYEGGNICLECDPSSFVLIGTTCSLINGLTLTPQLLSKLYLYGGYGYSNPGDKYGQSNFVPTTYDKVKTWPSFLALNTFIIRGQYGHYISRMSNPVYSVSHYAINNTNSYKLLYHGSGGGLFLCIADVPPTMNVQLRSLTPISASNIIDFCIDYETNGTCLRCIDSYHLQNGRCYPNFGGCVKYRQNICIQCLDYYFLVQNRCVSDCLSVSDARSVLYFESSRNTSTLESYYGVSISQFYTVTVTSTTTTIVTTYTSNAGGIGSGMSSSGSTSMGGSAIFGTTSLVNNAGSSGSGRAGTGTSSGTSSSGSSTSSFSGSSTTSTSAGSSSSSSTQGNGSGSGTGFTINAGVPLSTIDSTVNLNAVNSGGASASGNSGVILRNMTNTTSMTSANGGTTTITSTTTTTIQSSGPATLNGTSLLDISALNAQLNAQLNSQLNALNITSGLGSTTASTSSFQSSSSSSSLSNIGGIGLADAGSGFGFDPSMDPNCAVFNDNKQCTKCANFYYKNKQNICEQVSPYCATYSESDGSCLTCYPGYDLVSGSCNMPNN